MEFGGWSLAGDATGQSHIEDLAAGQVLKGTASDQYCLSSSTTDRVFAVGGPGESFAEPGDSGSGLVASAPGDSFKYGLSYCGGVAEASAGQKAVVGVLTAAAGGKQRLCPTSFPEHAAWIAQTILKGDDGDGICPADDNCPKIKNDQQNSNLIAEQEWGMTSTTPRAKVSVMHAIRHQLRCRR